MDLPRGEAVDFQQHAGRALVVADGLLLLEMEVGEGVYAELLGPGDHVLGVDAETWSLMDGASVRALTTAQLLSVDLDRLLEGPQGIAVARRVIRARGRQLQRATTHGVIGRLPRVEDRVLACLSQLADRYGTVTPTGVRLDFRLTHGELGALVGARRPTATMALKNLEAAGVLHVDDRRHWILSHSAVTEDGLVAYARSRAAR